jgi:hypothetical protein
VLPLKGKNWVAANGCCTLSPHRGAMLAFDQKLLATERYAIDWTQSDDEGHILLPNNTTKLTDFPAHGDHNLPYVFDSFRYQGCIEDDLTLIDGFFTEVAMRGRA